MNREAIATALFAKLESVNGITTFSRRLRHWGSVPAGEQPACFLSAGGEVYQHKQRGIPAIVEMDYSIYFYAQSNDSTLPQTLQNNFMDQLDLALKPDSSGAVQALTLGGLVSDVRIDGKIETDEGLLGEQVVVIVPLKIIATV